MTDELRFEEALAAYIATREWFNQLPTDLDYIDEERAGDAYATALNRVLDTPAVTIKQIRDKAEILFGEERVPASPDTVLPLMHDLHRLAGGGPSRVFSSRSWLKWFERRGGGWVERDGEIILLTPDNGDADDALYLLAANNARTQAIEAIRERMGRRQVP